MTRISKHPLSERVYEKLFILLFEVMAKKTNKDDFNKVLFELLSPVERIMIAKRVIIIFLLMKKIDYYDTFILFSGDSDFNYLLKELKRADKKVIVASLKYHIAKELIESADYYLDLRKIKREIKRD